MAANAPPMTTPVPPAESAGITNAFMKPTPPVPEEDFAWLDEAAAVAYGPDDTGDFERAAAQPSLPQISPQPAPAQIREQLIREMLADPEGFVRSRAGGVDRAEIESLKSLVLRANRELHREKVDLARERAFARLKEVSRTEQALQNEQIRRAVANTYQGLVQQAAYGDRMALNTLNNPLTAQMAIEAAKLATRYQYVQNQQTPVSYQGGRPEQGSTVGGGNPPVELDETTRYYAERWGIKPEVAAENRRLATPTR